MQDVLAVGHTGGLSTMLVPGAGEPHYDSLVADPFQTRRMRREQEVHQLLDKLQPDMIVLDPSSIGQARLQPPLQPAGAHSPVQGFCALSGRQRLANAAQMACWIVCKQSPPSQSLAGSLHTASCSIAPMHAFGLLMLRDMWRQVRKEPKEVAVERKEEARAANAAARREQQAANDAKKRMKGKNKPSRRQRKKQLNVIEERKGKQPHAEPGRATGACS